MSVRACVCVCACPSAWPPLPPQGAQLVHESRWHFRHRVQRTEVLLRGVAVAVCNDKPTSFGAPDVLQACVNHMSLNSVIEYL